MAFIGMDVEQTRAFTEQVRNGHRRLLEEVEMLDRTVLNSQSFWVGADADAFRSTWAAQRALLSQDVLPRLARVADTVDLNIEEQERASAATDSSGPAAGTGPIGEGDDILGDPAFDPGSGRGHLDPDVAAAWETMTREQREQVAQEIVNREFARYGMDPVEISFEAMDHMGYWQEGWFIFGDKLAINEDKLSDPAILHTLIHEVRHAAQHEFVDQTDRSLWDRIVGNDKTEVYEQIEEEHGFTREEIDAWRENFGDRTPAPIHPGEEATPEELEQYQREYEHYFEQPTENDAQRAGREYIDDLTFEDLQELQRDAGVPVSERPN